MKNTMFRCVMKSINIQVYVMKFNVQVCDMKSIMFQVCVMKSIIFQVCVMKSIMFRCVS